MVQTHVKEVQNLINQGIEQEVAIQLFQYLTEQFERMNGHPETDGFQREMLALRKHDRGYFHQVIDGLCAEKGLQLGWRQVTYEPIRINRCEVCGRYFYDCSRNGRKVTCYNGGICDHEYEVRRHRPGTIMFPLYRRRVNEVSVDIQPDNNGDDHSQAPLNSKEMKDFRKNF